MRIKQAENKKKKMFSKIERRFVCASAYNLRTKSQRIENHT